MLFVNHLGEYSLDEGPTGVLLFCKGWPHERRSYEPMRFLHLMTACALLIGSHVIVAAGGSVAMDRTEVARGKQSSLNTAPDATDHKERAMAINCLVPIRRI